MSPIRGTPTRSLRAMTSPELNARLTEVKGSLRDLKNFALGQPRWWRSVPQVRAVRNCYRNELHRIGKILRERERIQNSTNFDSRLARPTAFLASEKARMSKYAQIEVTLPSNSFNAQVD